MAKVKVITESGFTCEIDREALDDWDFAEAAIKASEDKAESLRLTVYMVNHMLSEEDANRLKEHVKTKDDRVPASAMMDEVIDILNKAQLKN